MPPHFESEQLHQEWMQNIRSELIDVHRKIIATNERFARGVIVIMALCVVSYVFAAYFGISITRPMGGLVISSLCFLHIKWDTRSQYSAIEHLEDVDPRTDVAPLLTKEIP
jgi:hypothetical protein